LNKQSKTYCGKDTRDRNRSHNYFYGNLSNYGNLSKGTAEYS